MPQVVICGEGMLELSREGGGWRLGFGGDTLNTAIHLTRAGVETAYLTALGSDPFSVELKGKLVAEGLDTSLVLTHPARGAGLYAITTDAAGERSFTYWRGDSAAREMFTLEAMEAAKALAATARLFAFSLITMAILPPAGRRQLLDLAALVRANGGRVAFDGNYRPRLWDSADDARAARDTAITVADIGLPTLEDELALGARDAGQVAAHWQALGCAEVVVKLGAEGCRLFDGALVPPAEVLEPVDTSGAGDAFNAGYLAARLKGDSCEAAAMAGHWLAGWTIMRPGAIPAKDS